MLCESDRLPRGLLDAAPRELWRVLPGPTLLHLQGRRKEPLFVAVLLHGDEETGWLAARELLRSYEGKELPRSLSLLVGNVAAARRGCRSLPGGRDYNRIWSADGDDSAPERGMAAAVIAAMRKRRVFVTVDVHNNTGINPHYAYVQKMGNRFLQVAALFGRLVVFSRKPEGTLTGAFSSWGPSVAVECGRAEDPGGVAHTLEFLDACLRLAEIPDHLPAECDLELYHSKAVVRIPEDVVISFDGSEADLAFRGDLDRLNFRELPTGTRLAGLSRRRPRVLDVRDEEDRDVAERYFSFDGRELRTSVPFIPAMLTVSEEAVRQDCLGYLMERMREVPEGGDGPD